MSNESEVYILNSGNHLKARTSASTHDQSGATVGQMVTRADTVIARASADYEPVIRQDIDELTEVSQKLAAVATANPKLVKTLFRKAFDIKGQAGTFGYPLMTEIAGSLCDFIEAMAAAKRPLHAADEIAISVLDMHVSSLRLALERGMKGPCGSFDRELVDGLLKVVRKTIGLAPEPYNCADN
jgi:hypothetical protein